MVLVNGTVVTVEVYLTIALQVKIQITVELEISVKLDTVVSVEVKFLLSMDGKEPVLLAVARSGNYSARRH